MDHGVRSDSAVTTTLNADTGDGGDGADTGAMLDAIATMSVPLFSIDELVSGVPSGVSVKMVRAGGLKYYSPFSPLLFTSGIAWHMCMLALACRVSWNACLN